MVEHSHGKGEVTGSSPVAGSSKVHKELRDVGVVGMAKNRVISRLACEECKERNYSQQVGKQRSLGSLKLRKFCSRCRKHCVHKETK